MASSAQTPQARLQRLQSGSGAFKCSVRACRTSTRKVCVLCYDAVCSEHQAEHHQSEHGMLLAETRSVQYLPPKQINITPLAPSMAALPECGMGDCAVCTRLRDEGSPTREICPAQATCEKCHTAFCQVHAAEHMCADARETRIIDFNQDWGRMALAKDDFRMYTPAYKKFVEDVAFCHSTASHTPADENLTHKWQDRVDYQLSELAGDSVTLLALGGSGSDVNNLLVDISSYLVNKDNPDGTPMKRSCVLVMCEASAAARGYLAHFSSRPHFAEMYKRFRPAEITDKLVTDCKVDLGAGWQWMEEITADGTVTAKARRGTLNKTEKEKLTNLKERVLKLRSEGLYPGVLLMELITADKMKGFRACFLLALHQLMKTLGVRIAVDEVMTGLRCGRVFSYTYYRELGFRPDFLTIGKAMLINGLLAVNPTDEDELFDLRWVNGNITAGADEMVIGRCWHFLKEHARDVLASCKVMGGAIGEHLGGLVERKNAIRRAQGFARAFYMARGLAGMWYTNLEFKGDAGDTVDYLRLLPALTKTPDQIKSELVLAGEPSDSVTITDEHVANAAREITASGPSTNAAVQMAGAAGPSTSVATPPSSAAAMPSTSAAPPRHNAVGPITVPVPPVHSAWATSSHPPNTVGGEVLGLDLLCEAVDAVEGVDTEMQDADVAQEEPVIIIMSDSEE